MACHARSCPGLRAGRYTVPTNLRWARFPFCVFVSADEGGLVSDSVVLCHQVRVSDKSRLLHQLGRLSEATLAKVDRAVRVSLGV